MVYGLLIFVSLGEGSFQLKFSHPMLNIGVGSTPALVMLSSVFHCCSWTSAASDCVSRYLVYFLNALLSCAACYLIVNMNAIKSGIA